VKLDNCIVTADEGAAVWTEATVIWIGSTLTIEAGGESEDLSGVTNVRKRSGVYTFTGDITDADGVEFEAVAVAPQGPGCLPCGR
jgi:hypothetical protein